MKVTILGCGTSGGVPRAPLVWGACDPNNPKNHRLRASIHVEEGDTSLIVDTSPDLRQQILNRDIRRLDAVLYTHDHADHVHGIDDLRGFYQDSRQRVPVYGDTATLQTLRQRFDYIFESQSGYPAICEACDIAGMEQIGDISVKPFRQGHGQGYSLGYRLGHMAYSTDVDALDDDAKDALRGLDVWIVDALRYKPHPTHAHLERTLEWIEELKPKRAILTHLAWDMDYDTLKAQLPSHIEPAYDGMIIEI